MYINSLFYMNEHRFRVNDKSFVAGLGKYRNIKSQKLNLSQLNTKKKIETKKENFPVKLPLLTSYVKPRVRSETNHSVYILNQNGIDLPRKRREMSYFIGEDVKRVDQASQADFDL